MFNQRSPPWHDPEGGTNPDRKITSVEEHQQATDSAPVIRVEADNPSGERGTGQAETARAVCCSIAFPFTFVPLGQTTLNHRTY